MVNNIIISGIFECKKENNIIISNLIESYKEHDIIITYMLSSTWKIIYQYQLCLRATRNII